MSDVVLKQRGRKPKGQPWTEGEEARLRQMRREGVGFKDIARKLGRSRDGCIGKWDRMSGRNVVRAAGQEAPERRPISLAGPAWSRPERYQS